MVAFGTNPKMIIVQYHFWIQFHSIIFFSRFESLMIPPVPQTVEESPSSWNVVIPMQYVKCSQGLLLRELCRPID